MKARSWCTGYEGLEMAVRAAFGEFEVLSHSEIKPAANTLLAHHHPNIPNLGDMRAVDHTALERADLMIGSWPCQPHSSAGRRLGEADPRDLWPEYLRAIREGRPAIFFGENVARIASNGELARVARSLAELGYVGAWRCIRAADVGACHRRDRCFVVAVDPDSEGVGRWTARWHDGARSQELVARPDAGTRQRLTLLPTPHQNATTGPGTSGRKGGLNLQTAVDFLPTPAVADARNTRNATAGRSEGQGHHHSGWTLSDVAYADRWGKYAAAIARHEVALGRPAPAPTQLGPRGGFQLSPRFVEWMMMLDEGWVTDVPNLAPRANGARNAMISLLGDGVVPAQGAAAFSELLGHLAVRLGEVAA